MPSQSKLDDTGTEMPSKANMWPCGTTKMQSDSKDVSDGINGTLPIPDRTLNAMRIRPGDTVRILVEAKGKWVTAVRQVYSNGQGVTLPLKKRKELGLEPGDEVEYWVEPHEDVNRSRSSGSAGDTAGGGNDNDNQVLVFEGQASYHYITSEDANQTLCGIDLQGKEYSVGSDPGDLLEPCENCKDLTSNDMTNKELAEWLSDEIGFDIKNDNVPSYFNNRQLTMIRNYIVELKQKAGETSEP